MKIFGFCCITFKVFRNFKNFSLNIRIITPEPLYKTIWAAPSEFGTYRLCEQRRFRRACASAQSRQNLRCSLIQAVSQEEPSDRKPDPWPLWMAGHAQLKFVMTECSKTQIRLTGLIWFQATILNVKLLKWMDEREMYRLYRKRSFRCLVGIHTNPCPKWCCNELLYKEVEM